jgi:hypothetical protein
MNIMERTPARIHVAFDGMTFEQVRDLIEERFGALMWGPDGRAYPADGVCIKMGFGEPAGDVARRSIERKKEQP